MTIAKLCKGGDDVLKPLFEAYGANILRVPEARVKPLTVFARQGDRHVFRGRLGPLLVGRRLPTMRPEESPMAEVSGKRTRKVGIGMGLDILQGLLAGLGLPAADVAAEMSSARQVSFA